MQTLKKWWPSIVTVLAAAATAFTPAIQHLAATHPQYTAVILAAWGLTLHILESPTSPTPS
jgi:hypothetical protein